LIHQHDRRSRAAFKQIFQYEIVDANTASVVSSALGIPIVSLADGMPVVAAGSRPVRVNQSQLKKQQPNITALVATIE